MFWIFNRWLAAVLKVLSPQTPGSPTTLSGELQIENCSHNTTTLIFPHWYLHSWYISYGGKSHSVLSDSLPPHGLSPAYPGTLYTGLEFYSPSISKDRGLDFKYYKQRQNIWVFLWVALSRTRMELCVVFLLGEVVVGISRYINKMGHSRAISAHCDIPSK